MYETWLRSFHAVARHQGFTNAAKALNLSQPTITEQVKALEGKFGVELFHRRGRTVRLTDQGRALYGITQGMAGHMDEAVRFLETATEAPAGRFAIGSVTPYFIMAPIKSFRDRFPSVETVLTVDHRREIVMGLLDFRLDVALIGRSEPDPRIANVFIGHREVLILLPADHPLARKRAVSMHDLDRLPMVLREERSTTRQAFEQAADRTGIHIEPIMEIDSREAIRDAVALGIGFSLGTADENLSDPRIAARPVADADLRVDLHLACLKNRAQRPLIDTFAKIAVAETLAP